MATRIQPLATLGAAASTLTAEVDTSATGSYPPVRMRTALLRQWELPPMLDAGLDAPSGPANAAPSGRRQRRIAVDPPERDVSADRPRGLLSGLRGGITRRHAAFAIATLVVLWLLFTFARAVSQSTAATDRVAALQAENATLAAQLEAGRRELGLISSETFAGQAGRAYGMGRSGERVFTLAEGVGPRPAMVPLGEEPGAGVASTPLEDWLTVLFGA
jgi:cell division protein FtsB